MVRGEAVQTKVHYKGNTEDFVIFVDSPAEVKKWKEDKSIALANFISSFKIFVTHKHGAQGQLDGASNSTLDNEFGTHVEDEVIKLILEKGSLQEVEGTDRQGPKNDSMGSRAAH
ncbi:shwachman-Bodian-Diamond syndrome protein [Phlyctema vagabunda]|uniref:Shwachman-Bodian-Diamond syndrome protein n=1 Tax=Phlyctema vagabunda TaxID=108571 RepID=A0ABR4PN99_9HELO